MIDELIITATAFVAGLLQKHLPQWKLSNNLIPLINAIIGAGMMYFLGDDPGAWAKLGTGALYGGFVTTGVHQVFKNSQGFLNANKL